MRACSVGISCHWEWLHCLKIIIWGREGTNCRWSAVWMQTWPQLLCSLEIVCSSSLTYLPSWLKLVQFKSWTWNTWVLVLEDWLLSSAWTKLDFFACRQLGLQLQSVCQWVQFALSQVQLVMIIDLFAFCLRMYS